MRQPVRLDRLIEHVPSLAMESNAMRAAGAVFAFAAAAALFGSIVYAITQSPGVVGSIVTAVGAIVAVLVQRERENRREVAQRHREQLAPMYEELFKRFAVGLDAANAADSAFMFELQRKLLFWGSTPVVREWVAWLRSTPGDMDESVPNDPRILLRWEKVLLTIRADLGHKTDDLRPGDLLRVYITDFDLFLKNWLTAGGTLTEAPPPVADETDASGRSPASDLG